MQLIAHRDKPGRCFQVRCVMDDGIPFIVGSVAYAPTGPLTVSEAAMLADTLMQNIRSVLAGKDRCNRSTPR